MTTQEDIMEIRSIARELKMISIDENLGAISDKFESMINNLESKIQSVVCARCSCKMKECYTCFYDVPENKQDELFCLSVDVERCKEVSDKCVTAYNEIINTLKVLYPMTTVKESIEAAKKDSYSGVNFFRILYQLQMQHIMCEDELKRERQST